DQDESDDRDQAGGEPNPEPAAQAELAGQRRRFARGPATPARDAPLAFRDRAPAGGSASCIHRDRPDATPELERSRNSGEVRRVGDRRGGIMPAITVDDVTRLSRLPAVGESAGVRSVREVFTAPRGLEGE